MKLKFNMSAGTVETPYGVFSLRIFLGTFAITSIVLVIAIYSMPPQYVVRSALEVSSTLVGDKLEALEPPDQLVKQITGLYLPDALATLASKGMPVNMLRQLENMKVDTVGRFITLQSQGDTNSQPGAKELQQTILDQIIRQRQSVTEAIRSGFSIRLDLTRRTNGVLTEQAKSLTNRIEDTQIRLDDARNQNIARQASLSDKIRNSTIEKDLQRRTILEAEVRELQDQVFHGQILAKDLGSEQLNSVRELAEVSKQIAEQTRNISLVERDSQMLIDPRQAMAPSVLPIPAGPRRLYLILSAIAISFLTAVGTAALWQRLRPLPK